MTCRPAAHAPAHVSAADHGGAQTDDLDPFSAGALASSAAAAAAAGAGGAPAGRAAGSAAAGAPAAQQAASAYGSGGSAGVSPPGGLPPLGPAAAARAQQQHQQQQHTSASMVGMAPGLSAHVGGHGAPSPLNPAMSRSHLQAHGKFQFAIPGSGDRSRGRNPLNVPSSAVSSLAS